MALGRKDVTVTSTNGGTDIFRLAGLFGDDNLIRHQGLVWWTGFVHPERIVNYSPTASHPLAGFASGRQNRGETPPSGPARRRCRRSRLRHQRESISGSTRAIKLIEAALCAEFTPDLKFPRAPICLHRTCSTIRLPAGSGRSNSGSGRVRQAKLPNLDGPERPSADRE